MEYFGIVGFENMQNFDKKSPPWIKLWKHFVRSYSFGKLTNPQKLLFIDLCMAASEHANRLSTDKKWLRKQLFANYKDIDLEEFHRLNLIFETTPFFPSRDRDRAEKRRDRDREETEQKNSQSKKIPVDTETNFTEIEKSVRDIFQFWKVARKKDSSWEIKPENKELLRTHLGEGGGITPERIKLAILGVKYSKFHMGDNKLGKVLDNLGQICESYQVINELAELAIKNGEIIQEVEYGKWADTDLKVNKEKLNELIAQVAKPI